MSKTIDWNIEKNKLFEYKVETWNEDYFTTCFDDEFSILVYNIDEWRMLCYTGNFAIFKNKKSPEIEFNSEKLQIWFAYENTFYFLNKSRQIIFRNVGHKQNKIKGSFPFVIINLNDRKYGLIDFDLTSIYYGFEEIDENNIRLIEIHSEELINLKDKKRTGEIFDLREIKWFDLNGLDNRK